MSCRYNREGRRQGVLKLDDSGRVKEEGHDFFLMYQYRQKTSAIFFHDQEKNLQWLT